MLKEKTYSSFVDMGMRLSGLSVKAARQSDRVIRGSGRVAGMSKLPRKK